MEEKNKHILQSAIQQLPIYRAEQGIWCKIEEELEKAVAEKKRENLANAVYAMPVSKAPASIWENVEAELGEKLYVTHKSKIKFYLQIVASIALVIGLGVLMNNYFTHDFGKESLAFSKETVIDNSMDTHSQSLEGELSDLIQQQCQNQPVVCENPQVTELRGELAELGKSLEEVKELYADSNNDPETYKYILRIEKEKTEISKKLLQYFNS